METFLLFELMATGDEGTVKYCDKGDTEGDLEFVVTANAGVVESVDLTAIVWSEFVVPTTTGVVESVDLTASVWSEFVLGDLEFVVSGSNGLCWVI